LTVIDLLMSLLALGSMIGREWLGHSGVVASGTGSSTPAAAWVRQGIVRQGHALVRVAAPAWCEDYLDGGLADIEIGFDRRLSLEELDRLCSAVIAKGVHKLRGLSGTPLATSHFGPCLNRSE
jgi:hypothetical protein